MAETPADASAKVAPRRVRRAAAADAHGRGGAAADAHGRGAAADDDEAKVLQSPNANDFGTIYLGAQKSISVECAD